MTDETTAPIVETDTQNVLIPGVDEESIFAADEVSVNTQSSRKKRTTVYESSAAEKSRIRMFRIFVVGMLLMTAVVTATAYFFLDREENRNFETAVRHQTIQKTSVKDRTPCVPHTICLL